MSPQQYDNLTYRQFTNAVNGFFKLKETESRERLTMMRNMMYAALLPHSKKIKKPSDVMEFDWEKPILKKLTEEDAAQLEAQAEAIAKYWEETDAKLGKKLVVK